jgi:hypothetical protein
MCLTKTFFVLKYEVLYRSTHLQRLALTSAFTSAFTTMLHRRMNSNLWYRCRLRIQTSVDSAAASHGNARFSVEPAHIRAHTE